MKMKHAKFSSSIFISTRPRSVRRVVVSILFCFGIVCQDLTKPSKLAEICVAQNYSRYFCKNKKMCQFLILIAIYKYITMEVYGIKSTLPI